MSQRKACFMDIQSTPDSHRVINRDSWKRSEHFDFFNQFSEPFFSVCAEIDCSGLVRKCRNDTRASTLPLWHGVLKAANQIEEFRCRIKDGRPVIFDKVHLSPTVLRPDKTFTVSFVPYLEEPEEFFEVAQAALEKARLSSGFSLSESARRVDLIHFSSLPWFRFTGLTHARPMVSGESEPKITIGRFGERDGKILLPVSVTAHHGFVDGYQVARYLETLESITSP